MKRVHDWEDKYQRAVGLASAAPFAYGVHDCALFAAYVAGKITGEPILDNVLDTVHYNSRDGADRIIEANGGLVALVDLFVGSDARAPINSLRRGDVVVAINPAGVEVIAVHDGHVLLAPGPDGIVSMPLRYAFAGWRIG